MLSHLMKIQALFIFDLSLLVGGILCPKTRQFGGAIQGSTQSITFLEKLSVKFKVFDFYFFYWYLYLVNMKKNVNNAM